MLLTNKRRKVYDFFVLGLIPGTEIQISFAMWLETVALLCTTTILVRQISQRRSFAYEIVPTIGSDFMLQRLPARWTLRIAVALLADSAEHLLRSRLQALATALNK